MELNDKDKKMYEWLKRQHTAWPVMRWIIVLTSLLSLLSFFVFYDDEPELLIVKAIGF